MDISYFFRPLSDESLYTIRDFKPGGLGNSVQINGGIFPDWEHADILLIGCDEDRGTTGIKGAAMAPDVIRRYLYKLSLPVERVKVADLGNLQKKDKLFDYYDALAHVVSVFVQANKTVILLGGSNDLAYGQYMGYEKLKRDVEYVSIDARLDMDNSDFGVNNTTQNHKVFLYSPNYLYHFANLGYQSYFVTEADRKTIKSLNFEAFRLGDLKADLSLAEPVLRDADLVSLDVSSVRHADAPGSWNASPPGFSAEEICRLARYAGISNRVTSLSICEVNPLKDLNEQTSHLAAMMIWYFIEGFYHRKYDHPNEDKTNVTAYRVQMKGMVVKEIIFYKSNSSDRWWMEVPYPATSEINLFKRQIVACTPQDFATAEMNEIPDKWMLTYYKLK
jgi:arginase family enzyme